jgi:hypothetical protein
MESDPMMVMRDRFRRRTAELLNENSGLRVENDRLECENADLRTQLRQDQVRFIPLSVCQNNFDAEFASNTPNRLHRSRPIEVFATWRSLT